MRIRTKDKGLDVARVSPVFVTMGNLNYLIRKCRCGNEITQGVVNLLLSKITVIITICILTKMAKCLENYLEHGEISKNNNSSKQILIYSKSNLCSTGGHHTIIPHK